MTTVYISVFLLNNGDKVPIEVFKPSKSLSFDGAVKEKLVIMNCSSQSLVITSKVGVNTPDDSGDKETVKSTKSPDCRSIGKAGPETVMKSDPAPATSNPLILKSLTPSFT